MKVSECALIVDPWPDEVSSAAELLKELGCEPTVVTTFEEGTRRLATAGHVTVLITAVRLREFNGVHLALRARALFPSATILVTDHAFDPVIETEAQKIGATYLVKPLDMASLAKLLESRPRPPSVKRRWERKAVAGGVPALIGDLAGRLVDVSYGGVRLEVPRNLAQQMPPAVEVSLPRSGLAFRVHPVWATSSTDADVWVCGGELLQGDAGSTDRWKQYVDSYSESP